LFHIWQAGQFMEYLLEIWLMGIADAEVFFFGAADPAL
jgi:hypothetical protein